MSGQPTVVLQRRPSVFLFDRLETKMNCFKRLGEWVMARTFERQVTELHIRVALLNRSTSSDAR